MRKKAPPAKPRPLKFFLHDVPRLAKARSFLESAVRHTLKEERVQGPGELHIVFLTDPQIRRLNRKYHNSDKPTDVLAFGYSTRNSKLETLNSDFPWGDVYVSLDHARSQGPLYGHTFLEELTFLVIHGILHILGYRDDTVKFRARMLARQEELLQAKNP